MRTLQVWDSPDEIPLVKGPLVVSWDGYVQNEDILSLLCQIDENKVRFRLKYTNWIASLGNYQVDGKTIVDHLSLEHGFSMWWMSLLVEKSIWKSPAIIDALRIFALEEILLERKPKGLELVSDNDQLHKIIKDLCKSLNIDYNRQRVSKATRSSLNFRAIYNGLPNFLKALLSLLRYVSINWALRKSKTSTWFNSGTAVFFCSYFDNIDQSASEQGKFHSFYWRDLTRLLGDFEINSNWLQLFVPDDESSDQGKVSKWISGFNSDSSKQGRHNFLGAYLSLPLILDVLKKYIKIRLKNFKPTNLQAAFRTQDSHFSLWPIFGKDWNDSIKGSVAINNILLCNLFESAMKDLPRQNKGFYLCENQAWERAFIFFWKKWNHGQLIAVPHSTRSFWDIRFFCDPNDQLSSKANPIPMADYLAINGESSMQVFLSENYSSERLLKCEALRYGYLNDFLKITKVRERENREKIKVLILGDYTSLRTMAMLRLLESAKVSMDETYIFTVKPHPNFLLKREDFPSIEFNVVTEPLEKILVDYDVAFSSNKTSASVDAYLAGLPVIVMLDDSELNMSPLAGAPNIFFVNTPEKLTESINTITKGTQEVSDQYGQKSNFFYLDPKFPKWSALLTN